MSAFDELEARREFQEALEFEEWFEASRARRMKPCPGCGMPVDSTLFCCEDCSETWDR